MKTKTFLASTLVEILIVMIISGIVFMALFDGVGLVRRYTARLNRTFSSSGSLLENYRRMDGWFQKCDSVRAEKEAYCFYWEKTLQVRLVFCDSILYCDKDEAKDTLWRDVVKIVPVPLKEKDNLIDSLNLLFLHKGVVRIFTFGLGKRLSGESEREVRAFENSLK